MRGLLLFVVVVAATLFPATRSSAPSNKGEFLALTYNVAGLPQGISGSDPTTNSPLISPKLNDYDLVLLQEDWGCPLVDLPLLCFYHEIVSQANHEYQSEPAPPPLGTDLRRFPHGPTYVADGLNQLSRFPWDDLQRHMWHVCFGELHMEALEVILSSAGLLGPLEDAGITFIDGGAADCSAQKGFTVSRIRFAEDVEIDVYNLHAEAGGGPADNAARAADFVQLADFMNTFSDGRAVIMGGDTNLHTDPDPDNSHDIQVWNNFRFATGLVDVCTDLDCGTDSGQIDKFAFRDGDVVEVKPLTHNFEREVFTRSDGEPLSDHDPLAVRFEWKAKPA